LGGLLPLPPPEGLPVVLGAFTGLDPFAIFQELTNETYSITAFSANRPLSFTWTSGITKYTKFYFTQL